MTAKAAEAHERRIRTLPEDVKLGWTPYRYRVEHGAVAQCAFIKLDDLRRWLKAEGFKITRVAFNWLGCRTLFIERPTVCGGTYYDGPEKRFARCDKCKRLSYEKYEGDPCYEEAK